MSEQKRKRLGAILVHSGVITADILEKSLELKKAEGIPLGQAMITLGVINDVQLARALAVQHKLKFLSVKELEISSEVIEKIPAKTAEMYQVLPIGIKGNNLHVAMVDPLLLHGIDDLRFMTGMSILVAVASEKELMAAIKKHYELGAADIDFDDGDFIEGEIEILQQTEEEDEKPKVIQDLQDQSGLPPIVRLANNVIAKAIKMEASDIHLEPRKEAAIVRFRVDGVMREIMQVGMPNYAPLVSRIKIVSNMDISVRRKAQDNKTQVKFGDLVYDLRVSTLPTSYGEKVTIRILNPASAKLAPEDLGFNDKDMKTLTTAISRPQGIVIVTGPTGSGKSSSLYACLNRLNTPMVNIVTVEDPVEFDVEGINQVPINPTSGITFAEGLRSILRQDPDIVTVGEVRDSETAEISFQAAQTGHLVLTTLHTNDASSAITRLMDLGINSFLITDAVNAVVGQRLARRTCPKCRQETPPKDNEVEYLPAWLDLAKTKFYKGAGCKACQGAGYSGRIGLFEVLDITPALKEIVTQNISATEIGLAARAEGFTGMFEDGLDKASKGLTTIEEVLRTAPAYVEVNANSLQTNDRIDRDDTPEQIEKPGFGDQVLAHQRTVSPSRVPAQKPAAPRASGEKIALVIDDNRIILKLLTRIMSGAGFTVITALNGQLAYDAAISRTPDIIITDYLMPVMNGLELIEKLRSTEATKDIPIIVLTSRDDKSTERTVIAAGANDFMKKPANAKRLMSRVERLIS